ncbi:MAG: type I 3-dehydroquinate dehydratase [Bacillota bacterium]|nr:type I 3-dehydroquinate dehydratase [Bacillota bacterium]
MKVKFRDQKLPMLLTSLSDATVDDTICTVREAIYDGTDGFLLHLEKLRGDELNREGLTRLCGHLRGRPLYTMSYRRDDGRSDEERIAEQLLALECGASMIDMMGDMYDPSPRELTRDPRAVRRQRETIERVHEMGGEVLLSSHTWVYMTTGELLEHCAELEARGADFIKIAMSVNSEEEALEAMRSTVVVSRALGVPFLHICMGPHGKLHRAIGPKLGSCFALCVQRYTPAGHKDKPLLRAEKAVLENLDA